MRGHPWGPMPVLQEIRKGVIFLQRGRGWCLAALTMQCHRNSAQLGLTLTVDLLSHITPKPRCRLQPQLDPRAQKNFIGIALLHSGFLLCWPDSQAAFSQLVANSAQQLPTYILPLNETSGKRAPYSASFYKDTGAGWCSWAWIWSYSHLWTNHKARD